MNSIAARLIRKGYNLSLERECTSKSSDEYFDDSLFHRSVNCSPSQSVFGKNRPIHFSVFVNIRSWHGRNSHNPSYTAKNPFPVVVFLITHRAINRLPIETDRQVCVRQASIFRWIFKIKLLLEKKYSILSNIRILFLTVSLFYSLESSLTKGKKKKKKKERRVWCNKVITIFVSCSMFERVSICQMKHWNEKQTISFIFAKCENYR